jgi:hypothetical protein
MLKEVYFFIFDDVVFVVCLKEAYSQIELIIDLQKFRILADRG